MQTPSTNYRFDHSRRLHGRRAFAAVFDARCRHPAGPITVLGKPNGLGYCRLGLSVARRVGNAVKRNRIKRLLREAFRLTQHDLVAGQAGYDIVVVVRPHEAVTLDRYQKMLLSGVQGVHRRWQRRSRQGRVSHPDPSSGDAG